MIFDDVMNEPATLLGFLFIILFWYLVGKFMTWSVKKYEQHFGEIKLPQEENNHDREDENTEA
jgi:hypothetical protein